MAQIALIRADLNSTALGEIISTHQTLRGAGKAYLALANQRGAYVAQIAANGSYPHRIDALDAGTTADALAAAR